MCSYLARRTGALSHRGRYRDHGQRGDVAGGQAEHSVHQGQEVRAGVRFHPLFNLRPTVCHSSQFMLSTINLILLEMKAF